MNKLFTLFLVCIFSSCAANADNDSFSIRKLSDIPDVSVKKNPAQTKIQIKDPTPGVDNDGLNLQIKDNPGKGKGRGNKKGKFNFSFD